MPRDDQDMTQSVIALAQFLGTPVRTSPYLPSGSWAMMGSSVVVAHDIWCKLEVGIDEPEFTLPDEDDDEGRNEACSG